MIDPTEFVRKCFVTAASISTDVGERNSTQRLSLELAAAFEEVRREERERCAKVCDAAQKCDADDRIHGYAVYTDAKTIAQRIRNLAAGEKEA